MLLSCYGAAIPTGSIGPIKGVDRRIDDPGICWESWGLCPPSTLSTAFTATAASGENLSQTRAFSTQSLSSLSQISAVSSAHAFTSQRLLSSLFQAILPRHNSQLHFLAIQ